MAVDWSQYKVVQNPDGSKPADQSTDWSKFKLVEAAPSAVHEVAKSRPESKPYGSARKLPERTWGEVADDAALAVRRGTRNLVSGLLSAPVGVANMVVDPVPARIARTLVEKAGGPKSSGFSIAQPEFVRGMQAEFRTANEADTKQWQSAKAKAQEEEFAKVDGLWDSAKYLASNPSAAGLVAAEQIPQFAIGVPSSKLATIALQAAGAGGQNESDVAAELSKQVAAGKITQDEANERASNVFAASTVLNAALPAIPGAQTLERIAANRAASVPQGKMLGHVAAGLAGEGAQGALSEAGDEVISNLATDKPWHEGVGKAAALGVMMEGPLGAVGGAVEARASAGNKPPNAPPEAKQGELLGLPAPDGTPAYGVNVVTPDGTVLTPEQRGLDPRVMGDMDPLAPNPAAQPGVRVSGDSLNQQGQRPPNAPPQEERGELLALPPPAPTVVSPDGTATTPEQAYAQQQADVAFSAQRDAAGLTPDVNRARARHPAAAPTLPDGSPVPDPARGTLSRAVNIGVANGAVQQAAAEQAAAQAATAREQQASQPIAEQNTEQLRERLAGLIQRGQQGGWTRDIEMERAEVERSLKQLAAVERKAEASARSSAPAPVAQSTAMPAYDTSEEMQDADIGAPSGGPFTIEDAAQRIAARTEGGQVFPVDGGFVVRTPQAAPAPATAVDVAAAEAATSSANDRPEPTRAQKDAGNYKKGHARVAGLDISIENPAGSSRRPEWPPLKNHYGYFKGTKGADKDHVDVFLTDRAEDESLPVFVVDQVNKDGSFDEHKVVMGAPDEASARAAYLSNYAPGWAGLGGITQMTQDEFKSWVRDPAKTAKPAAKAASSGARRRVKEAHGIKIGDRVSVNQDRNAGTPRSTAPYEGRVSDIEINAPKVYAGTAFRVVRDDATPDGRGVGWVGIDRITKIQPQPVEQVQPPTAGNEGQSAQPTNPVHTALRAIADGRHPEQALQGMDDAGIRAVGEAMGRRFSPRASSAAIAERLGEIARSDWMAAAQRAVDNLPAPAKPAQETPVSYADAPERAQVRAAPVKARKPADKTDKTGKPMDLLRVIAASGGLNRAAWAKQGVDPAEFTRRAGFNYVFRKQGGMTPSDLREFMQQEGYLSADHPDRPATVEDNDAIDLFDRAFRGGEEIFSPDQQEAVARWREAERQAEEAYRAEQEERGEADAFDVWLSTAPNQDEFQNPTDLYDMLVRANDLGATEAEINSAIHGGSMAAQDLLNRLEADNREERTAAGSSQGNREEGDIRQPEDTGNRGREGAGSEGSQQRAGSTGGDLFGRATAREEVEAERRRRDAERDGKTGTGRTDMAAGAGELFAGPRPVQADIEQATEQAQGGEPSVGAGGFPSAPDSPAAEGGAPRDKIMAEAGTVDDAAQEQPAPAVIEHNGTRIYQARIRSGEEVVTRFAVESADNKARREAGERIIGGDSLHATLEAAKNAADMERKQKEQKQANDAAQKAASDAKAQADAARKADDLNGFTATMSAMQAGKVKAALDKQVRFDGVVMTLRERVESLHSAGTLSVETFEEPAIKPMTRTQYNRATQREQDAHEAKMKAAGNKTVYLVNESDIGKTAYDYAQYLLAAKPAPAAEQVGEGKLPTPFDSQQERAAPAANIRNYGWDAVRLSEHSLDDLNALRALVEAQHANPKDEGGHPLENGKPTIHLYDKEGRRKLDALAWAVTYKLQESRAEKERMAKEIAANAPPPAVNSAPAQRGAPAPIPVLPRPQEPAPTPIQMTMEEWKSIHKDFKGIRDGQREVMRDGRIVAVEIVKDKAPAENPTNSASKTPLLDQHVDLMSRARDGSATPAEFQQAFAAVADGKDALVAELSGMTKDKLLDTGGGYFASRYKGERKADVVKALAERVLAEFALGRSYGPSSYVLTANGMAQHQQAKDAALRELVANTTEADLKAFADEVAQARAEVAGRKEAQAKTLADPQTLADFHAVMRHHIGEGASFQDAYLRLTPEQRQQYDALAAESTRDAREKAKAAQRTQVAAAGQATTGQVIETKHTREGYDLFVVQLGERVSREDYNTLNTSAKRMGGWYSKFRGNGAVPGFQFKTRDAADAFSKLVAGDTADAKAVAESRRDAFTDDRSQSAAERLRDMADALAARADEALGRDRKANTARRARMAAGAEAAARADKALAGTMRNLAESIASGKAKFLDAVRQKVQVEFLAGELRAAKDAQVRAKYTSYREQEENRSEPVDAETVDFSTFPTYSAMRSDLAGIARQMLDVDGLKKLGAKLLSVADDVSSAYTDWAKQNLLQVSRFGRAGELAEFTSRDDAERALRRAGLTGRAIVLPIKRGQNRVVLSPSEAMKLGLWDGDGDKRISLSSDFGKELVNAIGQRAGQKVRLPWGLENTHEKRKRLEGMGIFTAPEYRSALREFAGLQEAIATPDKIKEMERSMIGRRNDGLDFFPTSAEVVDTMLEAAGIEPGMAVLEPSAGMGHIADAIREKAGVDPDVVELSGERRELLEAKGYHLAGDDFLAITRRGFTYGDVFRHKDGTLGVMRGSGGMGSDRVGFQPLDASGQPDARFTRWENREDLTGAEHRGMDSGYDRIVMNPPFSKGRDIEHVRHAYDLLRPGGRIVAIMGEGAFFHSNKNAENFRQWLDDLGATSEKLPEGSFMDPALPVNTGVNARLVVIDKPAGGELRFSKPDAAQPSKARGAGLSVEQVRHATDRVTAQWGDNAPVVEVVPTAAGLPARAKADPEHVTAEGFYDEATGKVYLVAENLSSPHRALQVLAHEAVGHYGIEAITGPELWAKIGQTIETMRASGLHAELFAEIDRRYQGADRATFVREAVAVMAEKGMRNSVVDRVMAAIRQFLRQLGFDVKFTDADLRRHIAAAARYVRGNRQQQAAQASGSAELAFSRTGIDPNRQVPVVNMVGGVFGDPTRNLKGARAAARDYLKKLRDTGNKLVNDDTGWKIGLSGSGIRELTNFDPGKLGMLLSLPRITKVAVLARTDAPHDVNMEGGDRVKAFHTFYAPVRVNNDMRIARLVVREDANGNFAYDLQQSGVIEKENPPSAARDPHVVQGEARRPGGSTTMTVAQLREAVNSVDRPGWQWSKADSVAGPAFARWFGGSKVVTTDGQPKVVYHGTADGFWSFDKGRLSESTGHMSAPLGFFFAEDRASAESYARLAADGVPVDERVVDAFLSIERPFQMTVADLQQIESRDEAVVLREVMQRQGYDGIHITDAGKGQWIAFEAGQIKSATENVGTFDRANSDMRFSKPDPEAGQARDGQGLRDRMNAKAREALNAADRVTDRRKFDERLNPAQRGALGRIARWAEPKPLAERFDELQSRFGLKFVTRVFDQFRPLMKLSKEAFMQAHLSKGTDGTLEMSFLEGIPVLKQGAFAIAKRNGGVRNVLAALQGEDSLMLAWMVGNRAERLKAEGREQLFSDADIAALKSLADGKMPDGTSRLEAYKRAQEQIAEFNKAFLDIGEQAGVINAESRKVWEDEFYIPFYREMENDSALGPGHVSGLLRQRVIERLVGSDEVLADPLHSMLSNWSHILTASMRNMAANKALDAAVEMGIATPVKKGEKGAVWTMRNGEQVHWQVDDELVLEALESLHFDGYNNPIMKAAGKFKRVLTTGVTVNPSFRIRNLIRDTLAAPATADVGYNPIKNLVEGWKALGKGSDERINLIAGGGAIRFGSLNDGSHAPGAQRLIAMGVNENQILDTPAKVRNALRRFWDGYQELGDRSETVNRAVIYRRAIDAGKTHLEASFEARDLMNFTSMGSAAIVRALAQVLPFFNARLQGADRLVRGAKADPRRFMAVAGMVALASAALFLMQGDDEDYKELPDYVRDTYWPIKLGGKWLYIPKPFELGALGTIVERGTELMLAGDDYQAKDFGRTLFSVISGQLAMNPVPQIVRPGAEAFFNYDMFRGAAIDNTSQQRLQAEDRYTARTAAPAILAGKALGMSPQRLEHMVEGYFGWLGIQALTVGDLMARSVMDMPSNPARDLSKVNNWLVAGDFVKDVDTTPSKYVTRFYDMQREANEVYASAMQARRAGEADRVQELLQDPKLRARQVVQQVDKKISEINQQIRQVTANTSLSAKEKNAMLNQLNQRRGDLAEQADRIVRSMRRQD